MSDQPMLLTPKNVYRMMTGKYPDIAETPILPPDRKFAGTLVLFWWEFMMNLIPGYTLDTYFDVSQHRSRSLSNIMNRTISPSLPGVLRKALETNLLPDSFFGLVRWVMSRVDKTIDPYVIHQYLSDFEDACAAEDPLFAPNISFFQSLRSIDGPKNEPSNFERISFQACVRIAWLGIYAIYGTDMNNAHLLHYRRDIAFQESSLWLGRMMITKYEPNTKPTVAVNHANIEQALREAALQNDLSSAGAAVLKTLNTLPMIDASASGAGWFVVSNWTDNYVFLNNFPGATYNGAKSLITIPNGTLLYITNCENYQGLHNSPGVWGHTVYKGLEGYVPMNLIVKLLV